MLACWQRTDAVVLFIYSFGFQVLLQSHEIGNSSLEKGALSSSETVQYYRMIYSSTTVVSCKVVFLSERQSYVKKNPFPFKTD